MDSCGGKPPGDDGGTGAMFQGTVTGRGAPRRLSCAARSRAFLGTNPAHLRRTGIPIHPTEVWRAHLPNVRSGMRGLFIQAGE